MSRQAPLPLDELLPRHAVDRALRWGAIVAVLLLVVLAIAAVTVTIETTVTAVGVLEPRVITAVRSPVDGVVRRIATRSGVAVQAGDTLLEFESEELQLRERRLALALSEQATASDRLLEARRVEDSELAAQLRAAEARLFSARAQFRRRAADVGIMASVDSVLAVLQPGKHILLDEAVAAVYAAQSDLDLAKDRLRRSTLYAFDSTAAQQRMAQTQLDLFETRSRRSRQIVLAPITGLVTTDDLSRLTGSFVRQGDVLFELADTSTWAVVANLSAEQVARIAPGQRAVVELNDPKGLAAKQYHGVVSYVSSEPVGGGETGRPAGFKVRIPIDLPLLSVGEDMGMLRRGYTLRTKIILDRGVILSVMMRRVRNKAG